MPMGLNFGLGLGNQQQGTEPYVDLTLPQAANIIRAWGLRRVIPAYANGNALKEIREEGGAETNVQFMNNGNISIAGASAFAAVLYDQKGADASKVLQGTFALCPKVHDVTAGTYLFPAITAGEFWQMAVADAAIETATAGIPTNGISISLWVRCSSVAKASYFISRRSTGSGYLGVFRNYATILARIGSPLDTPLLTGMQANVWYHVVITAKGSTDEGNNGVNSYINASGKVTQDIKTVSAGATRFCIGYGLTNTDGTDNINDVILWDRELSGDEVLALFNAQCGYYGVSAK